MKMNSGRTIVPLKVIADSLGAKVEFDSKAMWDHTTNTILIASDLTVYEEEEPVDSM